MVRDSFQRWWILATLVVLMIGAATGIPGIFMSNAQALAGAQLQPQAAVVINFPNGGISYSPANVRINVGDEVEWQGAGGPGGDFSAHPLVSDEGLWPVQNVGTTFTFRFTQAGLYHFHCQIHGPLGMTGTVLVLGTNHIYLPLIVR